MTLSYSGTTITITGTILPVSRKVTRKQNRLKNEAGAAVVYDRDQEQTQIVLNITGPHTSHAAIRNFIITTILFQKYPFTLTPDIGVNLGNGDGVAVTARYLSSNFAEIMMAYHSYGYQLALRIDG